MPAARHEVIAHENERFSPPDWPQTLETDVYLPADRPQPVPAVIVIHGGGWEDRSRADMTRLSKNLARHGLAAVNIDYRFAPEHRFPAQQADVEAAIAWTRENAERFSIDADRIGLVGFSSGAHLAAMAALARGAGEHRRADEPCLFAVVAGGIPADFLRFDEDGPLLQQLLGTTRSDSPDAYRRASPITHVSPNAPPFFLFHGTLDRMVPFEQAEAMHQALLDSGAHSELYGMRLRGHTTAFLTRRSAMRQATAFLHEKARAPACATGLDE